MLLLILDMYIITWLVSFIFRKYDQMNMIWDDLRVRRVWKLLKIILLKWFFIFIDFAWVDWNLLVWFWMVYISLKWVRNKFEKEF